MAHAQRTSCDTAAMSVIVPTSLLTAITLTSVTSGERAVGELVEVDVPGGVDADDDTAAPLDRLEHGMVLGRRAHGQAGHAHHDRVVGLGATPGEDDLAGANAGEIGDRHRAPRRSPDGRRGRSDAIHSGWRSAR